MARPSDSNAIPDDLRNDTSTHDDLDRFMHDAIARQRSSFIEAWERQARLGATITALSPASRSLFEVIALDRPEFVPELSLRDHVDAAASHQTGVMHTMGGNLASRITVRGAPFDLKWTFFQPEGALGTAARGPGVHLPTGMMSLDLTETYVDRPVAYGGWMANGAGVGVFFKPKSKSTYVRVAPYLPYSYRWKNDSSLQVARNRGTIACRIFEHKGPMLLDTQVRLWNDGTSWYQIHQDEQDGVWTDSHYFWASSTHWYVVWFWCSSSIDFATKTTFGSSRAFNQMKANVKWIVFEQWA
jgi:hypothetical protein